MAVLLLLLALALPVQSTVAGEERAAQLFDLGVLEISAEWNDNIVATTFATSGKPQSGLGHHLEGQTDRFVALPAVRDDLPCLDGRMMRKDRGAGTITCRVVELRPHGKATPVIEATVEDIGPWHIDDPYWVTGERPIAEGGYDRTGRRTNRAGIDVSPALRHALGVAPTAKVDWRWKTDANGNIVTKTRRESF